MDYSDITVSLFLAFRVFLGMVERVWNVRQYTHHRVYWKNCMKGHTKNNNPWSILFGISRKVDYEKVLQKLKNEYRDSKIETKYDFFWINEFEREVRMQKTFDVFLMSLFNINELWRDFRLIGYWRTSRRMGCNMHKTLLCFVSALTVAWMVNWWEETQTLLHPSSVERCRDLGYVCLGSLKGLRKNKDDECACVRIIERGIVSLMTAVLVGIAGLYVTYGQMLKIIFRNWLRFDDVSTVWEATNLQEGWEEETKVNDEQDQQPNVGDLKSEVRKSDQSLIIVPQQPNVRSKSSLIGQVQMAQLIEVGPASSQCQSDNTAKCNEEKTMCGFAMDRKAQVDDVFLLVGKKSNTQAFKKLVNSVKELTKDVRDGKTRYNEIKDKITERIQGSATEEDKQATEKANTKIENQKTEEETIIMVNLTRRMRNIIMRGTTIFSLAPTEKNDELLMLVAKGKWSAGKFLPDNENHKAISHTATQHYEVSFSRGSKEISIVRTHGYRVDNRKYENYQTPIKGVEFVCNSRLSCW